MTLLITTKHYCDLKDFENDAVRMREEIYKKLIHIFQYDQDLQMRGYRLQELVLAIVEIPNAMRVFTQLTNDLKIKMEQAVKPAPSE